MDGTLPWYRSRIIIGALLSIITKLLVVSGITGEFAPEDHEQLTDIVVLLIGGVGDFMALQARVVQKKAPKITAGKSGNVLPVVVGLMLISGAFGPGLTACAPTAQLPNTSQTTADEQALLQAEALFRAANLAASLAVDSGSLQAGSPRAVQIADALNSAHRALQAARQARLVADGATASAQVREALRLTDLIHTLLNQ